MSLRKSSSARSPSPPIGSCRETGCRPTIRSERVSSVFTPSFCEISSMVGSRPVAADISPIAVQATLDNAELNGLTLTAFQSDLFEEIEEGDFDLIVFNTPMIDKTPENDIEKLSLCDPHGLITESYLRQARHHVSKDGLIVFSICNNSAYEVMDAIDLDYSVVGFELGFSGFWRAIVGARI